MRCSNLFVIVNIGVKLVKSQSRRCPLESLLNICQKRQRERELVSVVFKDVVKQVWHKNNR